MAKEKKDKENDKEKKSSKSKHHKHSSEKHKSHKRSKSHHYDMINVEPIDLERYFFLKNEEFRVWLKLNREM